MADYSVRVYRVGEVSPFAKKHVSARSKAAAIEAAEQELGSSYDPATMRIEAKVLAYGLNETGFDKT